MAVAASAAPFFDPHRRNRSADRLELQEVWVITMGWLFAGLFLWVALGNLGIAWQWHARRKSGALVPLVGGLSGIAACVTLPFPALGHWWWTPLIVDPGSAYLDSATAIFLVQRAFKGDHLKS
jgi:hypothetical protein